MTSNEQNCRTTAACFLSIYWIAVCLMAMIGTGVRPVPPPVTRIPLDDSIVPRPTIREMLIRNSLQEGLPPHIALVVAWRESRWIDGMVSHTGDRGIMQLNPKYFPTAASMTTEENIHAGVCLLSKYWREYHDERLTWIAYNRGPAAARLASQEH